jgi:hypothetical protein
LFCVDKDLSKKNPEETAVAIGEYLVANSGIVSRYNVVKGFLNLVLNDRVWIDTLQSIFSNPSFGQFLQMVRRSWWNILHRIQTNPFTSAISEIIFGMECGRDP